MDNCYFLVLNVSHLDHCNSCDLFKTDDLVVQLFCEYKL